MAERPLGFILGKFLPPHRGHEYLCRFAQSWMGDGELIALVCSLPSEPIPGELRWAWMREILPNVDVRHCTEILPQEPAEHPDFWNIWREVIVRFCGRAPSHVFASEPYGTPLAETLGATFVPVDIDRELLPVSGSDIRRAAISNWQHIPDPVRPWFTRRVAVVGPESAGKTTLSQRLAQQLGATWVHEWARPFYQWKESLADPSKDTPFTIEPTDLPLIARGQNAAIQARLRHGAPLLISDTDTVTTCVWSQLLFGQVDPEVSAIASEQHFDLTLVLEPDVPWTNDGQRVMADPQQRWTFTETLCQRLDALGRHYQRINGSWPQRESQARAAIEDFLNRADKGQERQITERSDIWD